MLGSVCKDLGYFMCHAVKIVVFLQGTTNS